MPIYAYKCESCGHSKDTLQKISEPPLTDCPSCGAGTFKKQLTAAGFQLKGSGWYVTDFRGGDNKAAVAANPAAPGTDSKPAESAPAAGDRSASDKAASPAVAAPSPTPTPSVSTT